MKRITILIAVITFAVAGYFIYQSQTSTNIPAASVTEFLSTESSDTFARVLEERTLEFPRALGAHPEFETEWWYYTGNVETEDGHQFGYQFTVFRRAIQSVSTAELTSQSNWRTNQIYFAHAAIADIDNNSFLFGDKFSRGAAGLAGAEYNPYHVYIEDWEIREVEPGKHEMVASKDGIGFRLTLTETQPPVLQGVNGFSPKSEESGKATYYYSLVDIQTEGEIWIGDERFTVKGKSWKDHEVGTSFIPDDAVGWDWFSAQLNNDKSLMYGQIRHKDGTVSGGGSWIYEDSSIDTISYDQIDIEVLDIWQSDATGAIYPSKWKISSPEIGLELEVKTLVDDAELLVGIGLIYWEGPAYYTGVVDGEIVEGYGYVELTGYVSPIDF